MTNTLVIISNKLIFCERKASFFLTLEWLEFKIYQKNANLFFIREYSSIKDMRIAHNVYKSSKF